MKSGVITDCFRLALPACLERASRMGFHGVQIYATTGAFCPDALSAGDRKAYRSLLRDHRLEVSALCGDMGGFGFQIAKDNPARIRATRRIVELACDLETRVVTTHIGVIPDDKRDPVYSVMAEALYRCGRFAREKGVTLAIETGPESARTLLGFVEDVGEGVGVNLDPANLVMVTDQDPVEAVEVLGKYIVHTHAKDGRMLKKTQPRLLYEQFATGGIQALNAADYFIELPLGEGAVDFDAYVAALKRAGYDGYLTVERETGAQPEQDIAQARAFLQKYL